MSNTQYKTTELELASFLKAQGQRLLRAQLKGRLVEFYFPCLSRKCRRGLLRWGATVCEGAFRGPPQP